MADYVVAQAAVLVVPTLKGFQKKLEAELRAQQAIANKNAIKIRADLETKKVLGEFKAAKAYMESQDITLQAKVDTRALTEIRHKYEDIKREMQKGLMLNLKVAGMSLLPQLAVGLAAVNASMVQLSQTALMLPGLFSGAASSISSLLIGVSGVKDAFKEYGDAQKNAAQEGLKARNAALNVQNAYRDLGRSIKDAKRNLEDLNAQLRDAPLDEAEAIIRVQEAQAEAADKASKSGLQQQKDLLALRKAENDLADTRLRNSRLLQDVADANAKGVAGADSVREATDRLAKAQDEASTQATKLKDSLAKLSPNAQAFVTTLTAMSGQWREFRNSVQDRLFAGLDQEVSQLATTSLPMLQKGLGGIADALNKNVKSAFDTLQKPANQGFIAAILGDTAEAQAKLSKAIEPFLDGFLQLSSVGADFLPRLIDGLGQLAQRFENFIALSDANGSLDKWIEQGIDAFSDMGNAILNVGSILNSLSEAFTGSGGKSFLELLSDATDRLADFLKSDAGQERLIAFFTDAREQLGLWAPMLSQLPSMFASLSAAGKQVADTIMPFLTGAAKFLGDHPALVTAVLTAYTGWQVISPMIRGISNVLKTDLAKSLLNVFTSVGGNPATGLRGAFAALAGVITPAGILGTAITGLVTLLTYKYMSAQTEAAQAAQSHADALRDVASQIDEVSGKLTKSGLIDQLRSLNSYKNINLTGDPILDVTGNAEKMLGVTRGDVASALTNKTSYDALFEKNKQTIKEELLKPGNLFSSDKTLRDRLSAGNFTVDDLAAALAGDQSAVDRFTKVDKFGANYSLSDILQGYDSNLPFNIGDKPGLSTRGQAASNLQKAVGEKFRATQQGGFDARANNSAIAGTASMLPNNPFTPLGGVAPYAMPDGGITISVTTSAEDIKAKFPALAKLIEESNGRIEADASGARIIFPNPEDAKKYATINKYASGGLISGPGSGTSDSITARLSHGEYVVNADATSKHLPLLEQINGGGMRGYAGGGLIGDSFGSPAPVKPQVAPTPTGVLNYTNTRPVASSFIGSGAASPAEVAAGAAMPTPAIGPSPPTGLGKAVTAVGNFFKGAMGLGAPGYTETSTAVLSTENSAWKALTTPLPPKAPAAPVNPVGDRSSVGGLYGLPSDVLSGANKPKPVAPTAPVPAPKPAQSSLPTPTAGGSAPTVTHGLGGSPGPGNDVPHLLPTKGVPNFPGPLVPVVSDAPIVPTAGMSSSLPGINGRAIPVSAVPDVTEEVNFGAREAAKYGLSVASGRRNEPGSYHNIGQAGDYSNQQQYGPPTAEMTAFANDVLANYAPYISELIYSGVSQNVIDGKLVPAIDMPGSPYTTGQAGYHGDHVHIAWKPGALQAIAASASSGGGSPSNMPLALTPTGVGLPQLSFAPNSSGSSGTSSDGGLQIPGLGGFKLPSPEEYAKYVSDSWMQTIQNAVKNAGQIALGFVGDFFGFDLRGLFGMAGSALGGFGSSGSSGSGDAGLPANDQVGSMLDSASANQLPADVKSVYDSLAVADPAAAEQLLRDALGGTTSGGSGVSYDPKGGAEQWRPVVRKILTQVAPKYGIKNIPAWEDALVRQIQTESGGNPNIDNLNDSNGKGGTQQVFGLGQFLPSTFATHNVTGGDIHDPVAQIYAMIDYVSSKYGMDSNGAPKQIGRGVGYASGGKIRGAGSGKSDSIIARVSNGEYIVRAPMAQKHMGLLEAINSNRLPGFADGGAIPPLIPPPTPPPVPPPTPAPITSPTPPPSPVPPDPVGPQAQADAGAPTAPTPVTNNVGPGDQESTALQDLGQALSGLGGGGGTSDPGAEAPAGASPTGDPRAVLGGAPQNLDHNKPAVSGAITGAAGAIAGAVSTAIAAAAAGASAGVSSGAGAPAGAAAASAASAPITGLIQAGGSAISGAVNILSSLAVGSLTRNPTAGAYGTPVTPGGMGQEPYKGPSVVNNWNGGVHTSNNDEFYKIQQRRELQAASAYLPSR